MDRLTDVARARELDEIVSAHCHDLTRSALLRAAAESLRPGGRLLVVDHGSLAPLSWNQDKDTHLPTPDEVHADIALPTAAWAVEPACAQDPRAMGPGGQSATVTDHVLLVRRATG
ncbi:MULTISPECIES: hypothetical protein [unclassified Streptomyces]|uniref:hypothetical protein n=1 Tax=unclassified Streptomyces TaxID=2593676 RepID=UPI000D1B19E3|nr:hypothetical protein [Streptomyces sp. JHA26]